MPHRVVVYNVVVVVPTPVVSFSERHADAYRGCTRVSSRARIRQDTDARPSSSSSSPPPKNVVFFGSTTTVLSRRRRAVVLLFDTTTVFLVVVQTTPTTPKSSRVGGFGAFPPLHDLLMMSRLERERERESKSVLQRKSGDMYMWYYVRTPQSRGGDSLASFKAARLCSLAAEFFCPSFPECVCLFVPKKKHPSPYV